jgi:hypothetical protein
MAEWLSMEAVMDFINTGPSSWYSVARSDVTCLA